MINIKLMMIISGRPTFVASVLNLSTILSKTWLLAEDTFYFYFYYFSYLYYQTLS